MDGEPTPAMTFTTTAVVYCTIVLGRMWEADGGKMSGRAEGVLRQCTRKRRYTMIKRYSVDSEKIKDREVDNHEQRDRP